MITPLNVIGMTRISQETMDDLEIAGFEIYKHEDCPEHVDVNDIHVTANEVKAIYRLDQKGIWEQVSLIVSGKILIEGDNEIISSIYELKDDFTDGEIIELDGETILVRVVPDENGVEEYFFW